MNKMNLPPPFDDDAIPGRFSIKPKLNEQESDMASARRRNRKRPRTGECLDEQIVEEDEEEDEEEDQDTGRPTIRRTPQFLKSTQHKCLNWVGALT